MQSIAKCNKHNIQYYDNYCIIDYPDSAPDFNYWRDILSVIACRYSVYYVKNNSIKHMIKRLNDKTLNKIVLSTNIVMHLKNNKIYLYLKYKK